jgi:hypothetical protein
MGSHGKWSETSVSKAELVGTVSGRMNSGINLMSHIRTFPFDCQDMG